MRRLLAVLLGGLGIRTLLRRRRRPALAAEPADELRAKLAESRTDESGPEAAAAPDVDGRRADVHERARRAIDELGES